MLFSAKAGLDSENIVPGFKVAVDKLLSMNKDMIDQKELAEVLEVVAKSRARMAAGFQPSQEELEESKISYRPDPEELAELREAVAESELEKKRGFQITGAEMRQRIAKRIADYNL